MMARIMIAEDNKDIRLLLTEILTDIGHVVVVEADNGLDALKLYLQVKPDLLLIDNRMPLMNGIDVVQSIIEKEKEAKIIMCSADVGQIALEAAKIGVKVFISKPFCSDQIVKAVETVLNQS